MKLNIYHEIQFDTHTLPVNIKADVSVYRELWGTDADGRRGEWRTFVDLNSFDVYDSRENKITSKLEKRFYTEYQSVEAFIMKFLMEYGND